MKITKQLLLLLVFLLALTTTSWAADIQIQSMVIPNWQSTQPVVYLRITNDPFTDSNGVFHAGAPSGFFQFQCTVNLPAKTLTVPAITLPSTTDSPDNPRARYNAYFVDKNGRVIQQFENLNNFQLPPVVSSTSGCTPSGTCASWTDVRVFNGRVLPGVFRFTYTDEIIEAKIAANGIGSIPSATVITKTPAASFPNSFALSSLGTGILKNTTGTGQPSIAVAGTDFELPITVTTPITRTGQAIGINQSLLSIAYSQLTGVPLTFAPSAHNHAAADTNSGVFATARLGGGTPTANNFLRGDQTFAAVDYSQLTNIPATFTPSAHVHAGADITSGIINTARLGSGTANSTTFLRGDNTWAAIISGSVWGSITGTLSDQTDLNTALGLKAPLANPSFTGIITLGNTIGSAAAPIVRLNTIDTTTGFYQRASGFGLWTFSSGGVESIELKSSGIDIQRDGQFRWTTSPTSLSSADTGLARDSAASVKITNGSSGFGSLLVADEVYGAGWDGSNQVPTKNALYDKIQTLGGSIIAREVDGTPAVNPTSTLEFLQTSGFVVTDQTGGVARVNLAAVPDSVLATIATAGKVSDSALSANIPLKNGSNTFTNVNSFLGGTLIVPGAGTLPATTPKNAFFGHTNGRFYVAPAIDTWAEIPTANTSSGNAYDLMRLNPSNTGFEVKPLIASSTVAVLADSSGFTLSVPDDAITFAKFQNIATARLLGRTTASSGNVEEISIGKGLTFSSGLLSFTDYRYNIIEYGADPTCTTNADSAIAAAITAMNLTTRKGVLYAPPGCYLINSSIIFGNGNSTTISTHHGYSLIGDSSPKTYTNTDTMKATVEFKWNGSTDTTTPMIDVRGAISSFSLKGIHLNADSKAGIGLKIVHAQSATIEDISIKDFRGIGIDVDSHDTGSFNSGTELTNLFGDNGSVKNFVLTSSVTGSIGIRLGANGTVANWMFERGAIRQDNVATTASAELSKADHNIFLNVVASSETGFRLKPITGATAFPMNNFIFGGSWNGTHATTTLTSAVTNGSDTTINVADTTNFPTTGYAQIVEIGGNTETFRYTSKTGTTLVLTSAALRGLHNTAAIGHPSGLSVTVAMDVVIDESVATWTPTTGYSGLDFRGMQLADGAVIPTDKRVWGITDKRKHFGGNEQFDTPIRIGNPTAADMTISDGIRFQGVDGANSALIVSDVYGGTAANLITGRVAAGTALTPTATAADTFMIGISARGWGTAFSTGSNGLIAIKSGGLWTGSSFPTYAVVETTPIGSTGRLQRARMSSGGIWNLYKGADVASAATILPTGNIFHVTGTTGITAIGTTASDTSAIQPGTTIMIIFDGALTITHASGSLYLTGATNFTTSANDILWFTYDGTKWYETGRINN